MALFRRNLLLLVGLGLFATSAIGGENEKGQPKTVAELWKIIQAQQAQLEKLTKKLEDKESKPVSKKVVELDRKTDVLAGAVEKIRTQLFIPDEVEYKSQYGLGPAASKIYKVNKGLSIGGYGEANYQTIVDDLCT